MICSIPLRVTASLCLAVLFFVFYQDAAAPPARAAQSLPRITAVSAASFEPDRAVAPGSIVAAFTSGLLGPGVFLPGGDADPSTPQIELPTILGNFTLEIHGRTAGLFAAAGTEDFDQFNLLVPEDLEPGRGPILIRDLEGNILASGEIEIADVAPGIFTADSNGQGVPAAQYVRVRDDGAQSFEDVAEFDPQLGRHLPRPVDPGPEGEQVFLVLYMTGLSEITSRTHTRILLGGAEFVPDFVGPVPGFVGLDQVNFRIPRSLRGRLSLAFAALGFGASRVLEIEIAAPRMPPSGLAPPSISGISPNEAQAGESLEIFGANFHSDSDVVFVDAERRSYNAQLVESSASRLRVLVPFGAGSGQVVVRTEAGEASRAVTLRTSLSGIIQRAERQPNGAYRRVGIRDITVRVPTAGGEMTASTNEDGAFLLPGLQPSGAVAFYVDGDATGALPGINVPYKSPVRGARDNQFPGYIEIKAVSGETIPAVDRNGRLPENPVRISNSGVAVEPQGALLRGANAEAMDELTITVLDPGRVPANLPAGHFSSTIVQITPTGAQISPGLKLTFPNSDHLPAGAEVSLFQYEVRSDSERIGEFVETGSARVSADGQRIDTADNAITVASYYFVSVRRQTVTLYGSVTEEDDTPARGALVQVHGQSVFSHTDDNGAFILAEAPILGDGKLTIEVSYLRPSGEVDRVERTIGNLRAGELRFVSPAIVLPGEGRRRAPIILAPRSLTVEAGRISEFSLLIYELRATGPLQSVTVAGAGFASIAGQGEDRYRLRLAPGLGAAGDYSLRVSAVDDEGIETTTEIALAVRANEGGPVALSRTIVTDEDEPAGVQLAALGANTFRITNLPRNGRLQGAPPNLTYFPDEHFNGTDVFSFVAGNGAIESAPADVTILVRPVNDAPAKEVAETYRVKPGARLVVVINGSDVDPGQELHLTARNLPAGAEIIQHTPTSWTLEWTPAFSQSGVYTLILRISDDHEPPHFSEREITIIVEAG